MAPSPSHVLVPLLLAAALAAQQSPTLAADRKDGAATIQVDDLRDWLTTLTSPEFGGRGTGQEGFRLAAEFVRDHFKAWGLEPRGDDGTYWQRVPWSGAEVDAGASFLAFRKGDDEVLRVPADRLNGFVSTDLAATGPVTLLLVPPPRPPAEGERRVEVDIPGLDDLDLKDHVVVLFLQSDDTDAGGRGRTGMARFAALSRLQGKNVGAVLVAETAAVQGGITGRAGAGRGAGRAAAGRNLMPASLGFGGQDLTALLQQAGLSADRLAAAPGALALPLTAQVQVSIKTEDRPAFNVVGVLPGSDPRLQDEYVVIGSHLDHLGRRGDRYFPGADDDGSGTVGVLAMARAFAKNPVRPRRSILFVTFCGEENGLVGSRWFVDHAPIPLAAMVAQLQLDMIGRDEEENREGNRGEKAEDNRNSLHLVGTQKLSRDLHQLCLDRNAVAGLDLEWDEERMFSRSDHANFARQGIPIAFFFTGLHRDYHETTDTVEKINFEKLARIATYVYDIAFELAQQDARPLVDTDLWQQNRGAVRGVETPAAPVRQAK